MGLKVWGLSLRVPGLGLKCSLWAPGFGFRVNIILSILLSCYAPVTSCDIFNGLPQNDSGFYTARLGFHVSLGKGYVVIVF